MATHIATKTRIAAIKEAYPQDDGSSVVFTDNPALHQAAVAYLAWQEMESEVKEAKEQAALDLKEAMKTAAEATISLPGESLYRVTFKAAVVKEHIVAEFTRRSLSVKKKVLPD